LTTSKTATFPAKPDPNHGPNTAATSIAAPTTASPANVVIPIAATTHSAKELKETLDALTTQLAKTNARLERCLDRHLDRLEAN
jgi:hypothetical protein